MSFSYSLMISWADSIIIWSLSIIKLTLAQFKKKFFFFSKLFFFPLQDRLLAQGRRNEDWAHSALLLPPPPPLARPSPTGSEGVREKRCREKGKRVFI